MNNGKGREGSLLSPLKTPDSKVVNELEVRINERELINRKGLANGMREN